MNNFIFGADRVGRMNEAEESYSRPSALPDDPVPAMAYVPLQFFDNMLELEEGFSCGTIFPELVKPFTGCDPK